MSLKKREESNMKRIKRLATVGICAIMMISAAIIPASANNHDDEPFTMFQYGVNSAQTSYRRKVDDSSMYMKATYLGTSYSAYAMGAKSSSGSNQNRCDNGYIFQINVQGREYFLNNWVNELCYSYGAIRCGRLNGGGYAKGVWSPDSV